jgi:hypothetical protein
MFNIKLLLLNCILIILKRTINNYYNTVEYLWSKRVLRINNYNLMQTEKISNKNTIKKEITNNNGIIWIRNTSKHGKTDLDHFSSMLNKIKNPVILITSDGDRDVPSSYDKLLVSKLLESPKILKWYTQNYDKTICHEKLGYYPIGLDMHTRRWLCHFGINILPMSYYRWKKYNLYLQLRDKYHDNKVNKIFCDSHLSVSHPSRKKMHNTLINNNMIEFQNKRVNYKNILKKYAQHRFVLSPRGNGLDCHRTWEIFLLGSIVITETSSLDDMYIQNNLPVIILNKYEELNSISSEELNKWYIDNKDKCKRGNILPKFKPSYWYKR